MNKFTDENGKESLMRKLTWTIVIATLVWATAELTFSMIAKANGIEFDMHEAFLIGTLSIGVAGKVTQKAVEMIKSYKDGKTE